MSKSNQEPDPSDETFQVVPVQSFTCKAIRVVPGMVLAPRLGRPDRTRNQVKHEKKKGGDTQPGTDQPPVEKS